MPRKKGKEVAKKTAQEGLVEWKKSDGKKLLKKELWDVSSRYHSMSIKDIHASDERFSAYLLKNFSANLKSLKKKIRSIESAGRIRQPSGFWAEEVVSLISYH